METEEIYTLPSELSGIPQLVTSTVQADKPLVERISQNIGIDQSILTFTFLLFIILATPYIFRKIKVDPIIGYIISGLIFGEKALNILSRDASIQLYGTVGLLYIMFIAGLEIDIADFKKNSYKSLIFGGLTFIAPFAIGILATPLIPSRTLLAGTLSIVFLASIYTSHTIVTYPTVQKYGANRNRTINVILGGTLITNVLALLILAIIVGMKGSNENINKLLINLFIKVAAFSFAVVVFFPRLTRKFLKAESDNIAQYLFVLSILFLAALLAQISGVEPIIGAFLAGIALNQLVPATSPLKNRIEFIGNAIFIPIFLIGVGMLIDFRVFIKPNILLIALIMVTASILGKYIAAYLTQKLFKYNSDERILIFGLSTASAAATIAVVDVGVKNGLLDDNYLSAALIVVLVTCTISSLFTEKGARKVGIQEKESTPADALPLQERILIPCSHPDTIEDLINLGLTIKNKNVKNNIYATYIITSNVNDPSAEKYARDLLDKAAMTIAATDQTINEIVRYDTSVSTGIYNIVTEHKITDIIIGHHKKSNLTDTFLGTLTEGLLAQCEADTYVYHTVQPLNTITKMIVVIPENAEKEAGFKDFVKKIWNLATNTGMKFIVFTSETIMEIFELYKATQTIELELIEFTEWVDFLYVSSKLDQNSGLMIYMCRVGSIARNNEMNNISKYLNKYFTKHNYILYYSLPTLALPESSIPKKKKHKSGRQ